MECLTIAGLGTSFFPWKTVPVILPKDLDASSIKKISSVIVVLSEFFSKVLFFEVETKKSIVLGDEPLRTNGWVRISEEFRLAQCQLRCTLPEWITTPAEGLWRRVPPKDLREMASFLIEGKFPVDEGLCWCSTTSTLVSGRLSSLGKPCREELLRKISSASSTRCNVTCGVCSETKKIW